MNNTEEKNVLSPGRLFVLLLMTFVTVFFLVNQLYDTYFTADAIAQFPYYTAYYNLFYTILIVLNIIAATLFWARKKICFNLFYIVFALVFPLELGHFLHHFFNINVGHMFTNDPTRNFFFQGIIAISFLSERKRSCQDYT